MALTNLGNMSWLGGSASIEANPIHCVIRGTAVNNGGAGERLTAPSQEAQEEVLRLACARAGVYHPRPASQIPARPKGEAGATDLA